MKGLIVSYRRGRHTVHQRQMLLKIDSVVSKEEASKLVGKEVIWASPSGKQIKGKVSFPHGSKGVVRVIFERGLPGQAIGTKAEVM